MQFYITNIYLRGSGEECAERSIAELMKLDMPKFQSVLKAHTRAAIQGRPNQTLLAAECARVISSGDYARMRAAAIASGRLV
jgi:hypothetical protein